MWTWYLDVPEYSRWMMAETLPKILAYIKAKRKTETLPKILAYIKAETITETLSKIHCTGLHTNVDRERYIRNVAKHTGKHQD